MKKKLLSLLALVLVFSTLSAMLSFACVNQKTDMLSGKFHDRCTVSGHTNLLRLHVRVNGHEVEFTDAHPYIDENNRTMIPLRAAVEALGAEVTWDQATRTASIAKNGITVHVTIDKETIAIEKAGSTTYTTMDTEAVLNPEEGRTYVPIRYVAESLGAFVDYSDAFRTVGIYQDQLTPDEIRYLQSYNWDLAVGNWDSWEEIREYYKRDFESFYPYYDVTPKNFANARECMYDQCSDDCEILSALDVALSTLNYESELYSISFRADSSCILTGNSGNGIDVLVRGYLSCSGWKRGWDGERVEDKEWSKELLEEANAKLDVVSEAFRCGLSTWCHNAYVTTEDNLSSYARVYYADTMTERSYRNLPVEIWLVDDSKSDGYRLQSIIVLENPCDYVSSSALQEFMDKYR